jgi:hypothetical protein
VQKAQGAAAPRPYCPMLRRRKSRVQHSSDIYYYLAQNGVETPAHLLKENET